jgi:hypothetical protein
VGLIWTVQMVHYPLFADVGRDGFRRYHARHTRQITWIVAPLMAIELATAAALIFCGARELWMLAGLVPLAFNWLATWRVQIPLHNQLATGFDPEILMRLVASNWWRTMAWSIRGACVLYGMA